MIAEEIDDAAMTEEQLDALLMHSWDDILSNMNIKDNPEKMKEELDAFFMMDTKENWEETEATNHSQPQPQPQLQPHTTNMEEQCTIDVHVNQPPQLESPPQPCSQPLPLPQQESPLQSQHQSKSQTDISKMTDQFFNDTWGYQPPLEMIATMGGHQPLQSQQQPHFWTWEENKAFESVIANCFQDAIHKNWETVAARLPGKTRAQLQERFLKLMTEVNAIKNGYPENIMIPMPTTPLEHSPLSIPIVNATSPPPPPPPHWTHHQHLHRMEAMTAAADMAVPMQITLPTSAMAGARRKQNRRANSNIIQHKPLSVASSNNNRRQQTVHWTLQEHKLFLQGYEELGKQRSRISSEYVKTRTYAQVVSHSQKFFKRQEERARGENLRRKSIHDITDYRTIT